MHTSMQVILQFSGVHKRNQSFADAFSTTRKIHFQKWQARDIMQKALSIISGILYLAGFVPYIRAVLRKEAQPAKSSWIIWAGLDTIALAGMFAKDSVNGNILGATLGAWTVAILSLKYGTSGWTLLDKLCLGGAMIGVMLSLVFSNPTLGIMTSMIVMSIGSIPTYRSAWKNPSNENRTAWVLFWISCVCAIIAIPHWTLEDAIQPLTFLAIETVMMYILFFRHQH